MRIEPTPHEVRELVVQIFQHLDVDVDGPWDIDETILINDGRYSARTYKTCGQMAMWLVDIGVLQFYDEAGNMLRTVNLLDELAPQRMAA